jgi:hypothetical protein
MRGRLLMTWTEKDEVAEWRETHRAFRLAILKALGVTDPWAITTWNWTDYESEIKRLRAKAGEDA